MNSNLSYVPIILPPCSPPSHLKALIISSCSPRLQPNGLLAVSLIPIKRASYISFLITHTSFIAHLLQLSSAKQTHMLLHYINNF